VTTNEARKWIILASLSAIASQAIFLLIAPVFGYPLEFPKNLSLLQILIPVMLGYLGSAAHFIFMSPPPEVRTDNELLGVMVKGPVIVYAIVTAAAYFAFGYSNRNGAAIGSGMSVDSLNNAISLTLGILAATTGVIVSYLFVTSRKDEQPAKPDTPAAA
jgi:hypothetical protein